MYIEEYGKENSSVLFMLHGLHNVHCFYKQYSLKDKYHIIVPHLLGFGNRTNEIFEVNKQIKEIVEYLSNLGKKVTVVGFSLGAILAFKLIAEYEEFFNRAVFVSPCLLWPNNLLKEYTEGALKGLKFLRNKFLVKLLLLFQGVPKEYRNKMADQMYKVQENSIVNAINCGISFDTVKGFNRVNIPVTIFFGGKEPDVTKESCKKLCKINKHCDLKIIEGAAHNIPRKFSKHLNEFLIVNAK